MRPESPSQEALGKRRRSGGRQSAAGSRLNSTRRTEKKKRAGYIYSSEWTTRRDRSGGDMKRRLCVDGGRLWREEKLVGMAKEEFVRSLPFLPSDRNGKGRMNVSLPPSSNLYIHTYIHKHLHIYTHISYNQV